LTTRIRAPEIPEDLKWLGTPRPLTLSELRGQVVILDFWTYCCINCLHVLPVLAALEEKRRDDPVVVIGVHSAKFTEEKDVERIREAMARYGVTHPVVVDEDHRVWQSYTVKSWPTLVVVRPDGSIAAVAPGEADLEALDAFVQQVLDDAREDATLARAPFRVEGASEAPPAGVLSFPGKVIALPGGRLAVSDSGHHRVLVLDMAGRVDLAIGSGDPGLLDGKAPEARFRSPQGLAFDPDADVLFVADTGNHAVRTVDLGRRRVRTAAGTGLLGRGIPQGAVAAKEMPLRSPWDVAVAGDYVFVAMAGTHQIWVYSRIDETVAVFAGSGREGLADGTFAEAAFAQPSGLTLDGASLYVADSETSAVRRLDLAKGEVRTLVGTGLFDFGDVDGGPDVARLQHPIGIAIGRAGLLVADTYNHKIKRIDTETGEARVHYTAEGTTALREPSGLCQLDDGRVVVADTNNHRLVVLSRDAREAEVLDVATEGLADPIALSADGAVRTLRRLALGTGDVTLRFRLQPPEGFDLAQGSRVSLRVAASSGFRGPDGDVGFEVHGARLGVPVLLRSTSPAQIPGSEGLVTVELEGVLCSHGDAAACWPVSARYRVPFVPGAAPVSAADVALPIPPPEGA
jgi:sugar lactone lactonase YvrE/peroxiredoxin